MVILSFFISSCGKIGSLGKLSDTNLTSNASESGKIPVKLEPGTIQGRFTGTDSGSLWKVAIMEFRSEDPDLRPIMAARPDENGKFEINLPPLPFEVPFGVIGFEDGNGNGQIDHGEDFVGSRSIGAGYSGKGMFLLTENGSFVSDRSMDLTDVEFVIDVNAIP